MWHRWSVQRKNPTISLWMVANCEDADGIEIGRRSLPVAYFYGSRPIDGKALNHKRVYRHWRREGLSVAPRRVRKRMRTGNSVGGLVACHPNAVWCFDFIEIRILSRQKLRVFCVNDEFTRENHAIEVETSFVSQKVCSVLEKLMAKHGIPSAFRMDNGPEFIALALRGLCHICGINAAYIDPGKPWQNGYAESFHSRLRDEYLDGEVFWGVRDTRVGLSNYRRYFNTERLHSSLGYLTPTEYAASYYHSRWYQYWGQTTDKTHHINWTGFLNTFHSSLHTRL